MIAPLLDAQMAMVILTGLHLLAREQFAVGT
jgi:hypothetical protein